jgi:hypothetical protein
MSTTPPAAPLTYTVKIADQHGTFVEIGGVAGASQLGVLQTVFQPMVDASSVLNQTDEWTLTITQP